MDIEDRLEVKVVAARGLTEVEGGECNPFAVVRCGQEFEQTVVLNHTTSPEWNSARMVFADVTENATDHVVVTVNHKNLSAQADEAIGQAIIDLRTAVLSPGIESDEWYELERAPGMKGSASGEIRIEMTYFLSEGDEALPDDSDDEDAEVDATRLPNMLVGTIVRARGLDVEGKELADAYATVRCSDSTGTKAKTKVSKKNNSPHWDKPFRLPLSDGAQSIIVKVKDHGTLTTRLIGTCKVPVVEIAARGDAGLMKWCKLLGEDFTVDGTDRGDVELQLSWVYDRKYARSLTAMLSSAQKGMRRTKQAARDDHPDSSFEAAKGGDPSLALVNQDDEEDYAPIHLSTREQEALDEQRENRRMMAERVEDDLERERLHEMAAGDYQIQVHVIEARDLNAEDLNGLSDPYIRVKILGRSKKTRVVKKVSSCVFDETLFFNLRSLSRKEIEEAVVDVSCYDFDTFTAHSLIGLASFDAKAVHARPDHELYHHWVGLVDTKSKSDNGYQGFLKLSITVLGPGDQQKFHDLDKEYLEEQAAGETEDALGGLAAHGPEIDQRLTFLVVYVWEAEDLPKMDRSLFQKDSGSIEAYVKVDFAGSQINTSSVSVRGKGNLAPVYHEELWLPVVEPVPGKRVTVGMWDYNTFSAHAPVAHLYFDYDDIQRTDTQKSSSKSYSSYFGGSASFDGPKPRWYNLYGAPLGVQGKRGALQNRFGGSEASTYRGRVLLSMEVVTKPSKKESQVAHRVPFRSKPTENLKPMQVKYHLRCLAVMGSEVPVFRTPGALHATKMGLVIAIGNHELKFDLVPNRRGVVVWNDYKTLKHIDLPVAIEDIPDACVYLIRGGKDKAVCYCRVPAASLLKEQFLGDPKWHQLRADSSYSKKHGGVALQANPGAILLKLGLGLSEDAVDPKFAWNEAQLKQKVTDLAPFCLRVYVFQARGLPASDDNGLLDPYVKVRFCGKKDKTTVHSMTTAPLFYETLQFHEMLPKDPLFGPDIVVQVWDNDRLGSNTPMAMLRFPLVDCAELASEGSRYPMPTWRSLTDIHGEPLAGELLISAALIQKKDASEKFNKPEDIKPQMRQAWVEVTCLGVRQLKTYRLRTPREPYVRVDVPAPKDGGTYFRTKASKKPSGRNANLIERKVLAVEMPENALFAQQMDLRVYDSRSMSTPLLGATTIDLAKKMSWNADEYVPPQAELFDDTEARKREEERLEAERQAASGKDAAAADDDDDDFGGGGGDDLGGGGGGQQGGGLRQQRVGVNFGDQDDDQADEEDALLGDPDAEMRKQYELERFAQPPVGGSAEDSGTGAFHPMVVTDLPMIHEDVLYQQEQDAAAEALMLKEEEELEGRRGILTSLGAQFKHATDLGGFVGEEETYKLSDLDITFPTQWAAADYLIGREWWTEQDGHELENFLKTKPFETYEVYRGKFNPDPSKSTLRAVGIFKGIVRVLDQDPLVVGELIPLKLLRESTYTIRLYVIKGSNLQPVDSNSADPYLRVKLGKTVDNRPRGHQTRTLKPNFYETFEFQTTLPGPSVLKIQVKDWNRFYPVHELIGETTIDLEDRWFHPEWQKLDSTRDGETNKLKPIEVRSLKKDTSSVTQGQVFLWLEIRPDFEARRDPPVTFDGPEVKKFEIRVVCWKSTDVPQEMGDYYCQFWIGDSKKQKTDIHWRCRYGKASWNYRVKIPVDLPLDSPEKGRLTIQLWDQDVIKWNDVIGEAEVDLYKFFLKAYHEKRTVNIFKEINEARERKKAEELGVANPEDLESGSDDSYSDDDDNFADDDDGGDRKEADDDDFDDGGGGGDDADDGQENPLLEGGGDDDGSDDGGGEKKKKKKKKKKKSSDEDDDDLDDGEPTDPKEAEMEDAQFFVKQLKDLVGLGDIDDTAQWIRLTYHNRKKGKVYNRGKVAISIEVMPGDEAELRPAGHGRSDPNTNPYLPPPTGRIGIASFYSPFALCSALLGDRMAYQILCCCVCLFLLVALGFLGMYWTSFYTLLLSLGIA